jgi:alanyl-tRNA synthetase
VDLRNEEDRRKISGRELVNKGNPRVMEIWNLVFIQYNRKTTGELVLLPKKHVDTGMGFERLCMVLQHKHSNYDTDIFQPVIQEISLISGIRYGKSEKTDIAMRVIADHLRAISFAIADGQLPSNAKAGYVIRRILRRAVRYNYTFLGQNKPVIFKLVHEFIRNMGNAFPELITQQKLIERVIFEEEQSFLHTLESGDKRLKESMAGMKKEKQAELSGKIAFELYDTYGFPLDLTELILKENGFTVNIQEFKSEMSAQRKRSKSAATVESEDWIILRPDSGGEVFVGYDQLSARVKICRYRRVTTHDKKVYHLVFDHTPFYAESGGQVGDTGFLRNNGEKITINNTFKEHGLVIHVTETLPPDPSQEFDAVVLQELRSDTAKNHTATHLLHKALREVLGKHVEQRGSLVNAEYLRFDFSHFQRMTEEEVANVEQLVNQKIWQDIQRHVKLTSLETAKEMGAMALFGEKYGEKVRVIQFGDSIELCGGTHVETTGQIGIFKIISESSIASGIRRIEAITGEKALTWYQEKEKMLKHIEDLLNKPQDVIKAISSLMDEKNALQKQVDKYTLEHAGTFKASLLNDIRKTGDFSLITARAGEEVENAGMIREVAYQLRNEISDLVLIVGAVFNNKPHLAVMVSDKLVRERKLHAGDIVKSAAKEFEGGGGGQPFFATAGGKDPGKLDKAMKKAQELVLNSNPDN